ncbi:MAG TPA: MASE3 domain-containing protein [Symbiobacteriaceae bacterium]
MQSQNFRLVVAGTAFLVALMISEHYSYLLFHSLVEFSSVIISVGIFILIWNLQEFIESGYLRLLGTAYLAVAWLDFIHALAFKGMGVFPGNDANMATQFWVAARFVQAASLLAAPFLTHKKLKLPWLTAGYGAVALLLTWSIMGLHIFPTCYVEGHGLTQFKIVSEYLIALMFLGALLALVIRRRDDFSSAVLRLRELSLVLAIFAELAFTFYVGVTDFANMLGHFFKAGSFVLIYAAIIQIGLKQPYSLLFQDLKRKESALQEERDFFSAVVDTAGALVVILNPQGRIVRFNRACELLTGYPMADVEGKSPWDLFVPPEEAPQVKTAFAGIATGDFPRFYEMHWVTRSGERRLISWTHTAIHREDGTPEYIIGSGMDTTERRRSEQALLEREERLRVIVDAVQTGMVLVDPQTHKIVDANPAFQSLVGMPLAQLAGCSCHDLLHPGAEGHCPITDNGQAQDQSERIIRNARGGSVPVLVTALKVQLEGKPFILESVVDMTERKVLEDELRTLSLVDDLTGLYNRRGFMALAAQQARTAARMGRGLLLLFLDMDELKAINDTGGHSAGDAAITDLAGVLRETFRDSDVLARIGGDEFVVLSPENSPADGDLLAARLLTNLEAFNLREGRRYTLSVSVGTSRWDPEHPVAMTELLAEADRRMYVRKRSRGVRPGPVAREVGAGADLRDK